MDLFCLKTSVDDDPKLTQLEGSFSAPFSEPTSPELLAVKAQRVLLHGLAGPYGGM